MTTRTESARSCTYYLYQGWLRTASLFLAYHWPPAIFLPETHFWDPFRRQLRLKFGFIEPHSIGVLARRRPVGGTVIMLF
ncbi:hypothetical protein BSF38_03778 [Paludisphaera borealis]|uniref:Uncharacterized protein n=1 Tax=Paludisphaera borealis TaxID=1387353 RepID=A0A1U7CTI9_9BACT|nr:hypothetical protein BSF38_03778 [Paludisphaera borealis]